MDIDTLMNLTAVLAEGIHTLAEGPDECRNPACLRDVWKALLLPNRTLLSCRSWHGSGAEQA